jgi:hypothetical protein
LASAYLCSPCACAACARGVPVSAQRARAMAIGSGCNNCRAGPCKPGREKGRPFSHGPMKEETQSPNETVGEMVDRIIGEVAREWVAQGTGLKR